MAEGFGNIMEVPGTSEVAEVKPDDILASYARFTQKGVTLAGGEGEIEAGTALGRVTASKKYVPYDNGASDGSEVCRGFLRQKVDTGTGGGAKDALGNIVVSGILKNDMLVGVDAGAVTDLNARQDTAQNLFVF